MGKAICYDVRTKIIKRRQSGESYKSIAEDFGVSQSGVKKIWYRYQKVGEAAYLPDYSNCGRPVIYKAATYEEVDSIRDNAQGAAYVHSKLVQKHPQKQVPSIRTLQRAWVKQGTQRPKGKPSDREKKVELSLIHI